MKIVVNLHSRSLTVTVGAGFTALAGERFLRTFFAIIGTLRNDVVDAHFPFVILAVVAIIGNQAFQNGRCHICFSSGLDKVETGYNLLMEYNALIKCLIVRIHTGLLAVSFYLKVGTALLLTCKKVTFYNNILRKFGG